MENVNREIIRTIKKARDHITIDNFTSAFNILRPIELQLKNLQLRIIVLQMQIHCLMSVGNTEAAEELVRSRVTLPDESGRIDLLAACFYNDMGRYNLANKYFLRAVVLMPTNVRAAIRYSTFLREIKHYAEASRLLFRCLRNNHRQNIDRRNIAILPLYTELAQIEFSKHNYYRALFLFKHASKIDSLFLHYDQLAKCHLYNNNPEEAKRCIELHLDQWSENDADAQFTYAKCLAALGKPSLAYKALVKASKISGELHVSPNDMRYLGSLMKNGTLRRIPNIVMLF